MHKKPEKAHHTPTILLGLLGFVLLLGAVPARALAGETAAEEDAARQTEIAADEEAGLYPVTPAEISADVYSLLIIGSDRRDSSWNGNSDTIILVTVNHDAQKTFMVSLMRDLGVDIEGSGLNKINYAYAIGGAKKLVETVTRNFGVRIDNYAAVDWEAMIDIVDALGGVDVEVYDYEVNSVNGYIDYYCGLHGLSAYPHYLGGSGMQHMDGIAALAYCRIRYVGNNDYERTERQRKVLTSLLNNVSFSDPESILKLMQELLTEVDHDLTPLDMVKVAGLYGALKEYELVSDRVPYDGMFTSQNEKLIPDQPATNEKLWAEIYESEQ